MTFDEIVDNVCSALNLTSDVAIARVGVAVNRRYRRVGTSIGMLASRRQVVPFAFTLGVRKLTVTGMEKVVSVQDLTTSTQPIFLDEVSYEEMLSIVPRTDRPTKYAIESITAHGSVLLTDFNPQDAFSVYVEGEARATTLSGSLEPNFFESYHDVLEFGAKADELRKMEKVPLARDAEADFERRLSELRYHIACSSHQDIVQGKTRELPLRQTGGGGAGSGGTNGATSYTQTGLITFDRDPSAPFAVTSGSAVVPNLDADKLDGLDSTDFALDSTVDALTVVVNAHHTRHESGGADAIQLDNLAAPDDNTDLNASTTRHGLLKKLSNVATEFMNGQGDWASAGIPNPIVQDLLFTDATYDIGKSGATRPRDLFLSRNVVVGGALIGGWTILTITATGTQNDYAPGLVGHTLIRANNASALNITGLTGGTSGQQVLIHNVGSAPVKVAYQTGSTAANQIITPSVVGQTIGANGRMLGIYDATASRWRFTVLDPGAPIALAYADLTFSGSGTLTWTVASGDFGYTTYTQRGKLVRFEVSVDDTTVSGSGAELRIQASSLLPGGFTSTRATRVGCRTRDNSTNNVGFLSAVTTTLVFELAAVGNWAAATNTTGAQGIIEAEVN